MTLIKSPSGASLTCSKCGTIYDNHPLVGEVPPFGDGCEECDDTQVFGKSDDDENGDDE